LQTTTNSSIIQLKVPYYDMFTCWRDIPTILKMYGIELSIKKCWETMKQFNISVNNDKSINWCCNWFHLL